MANVQGKKMTVKIVDCKPVYHGTNAKGDAYTIHEIRASKADGTLINEKLRSFSALPVGQAVEVTVTPFESEKHGQSFTLYPTGERAVSTTAAVNDIGGQVEAQRGMIATLANRVAALEKLVSQLVGSRLGNSPPPVDAATAALDAKFGADPPFD